MPAWSTPQVLLRALLLATRPAMAPESYLLLPLRLAVFSHGCCRLGTAAAEEGPAVEQLVELLEAEAFHSPQILHALLKVRPHAWRAPTWAAVRGDVSDSVQRARPGGSRPVPASPPGRPCIACHPAHTKASDMQTDSMSAVVEVFGNQGPHALHALEVACYALATLGPKGALSGFS